MAMHRTFKHNLSTLARILQPRCLEGNHSQTVRARQNIAADDENAWQFLADCTDMDSLAAWQSEHSHSAVQCRAYLQCHLSLHDPLLLKENQTCDGEYPMK